MQLCVGYTGGAEAYQTVIRSLTYEEISNKSILENDALDDAAFTEESLKQFSNFYYMDYDGDGLPELIDCHQVLYGLKYNPEDKQIYLFLEIPGSNVSLMGAGQLYSHNPGIANKQMYSSAYHGACQTQLEML